MKDCAGRVVNEGECVACGHTFENGEMVDDLRTVGTVCHKCGPCLVKLACRTGAFVIENTRPYYRPRRYDRRDVIAVGVIASIIVAVIGLVRWLVQ